MEQAFGVSTYPAAVLYSDTAWLSKNADTAGKLASAIQKAR